MTIIDLIINTMTNIVNKLDSVTIVGISALNIMLTLLLFKMILRVFAPKVSRGEK